MNKTSLFQSILFVCPIQIFGTIIKKKTKYLLIDIYLK